MPDDDAFEGLRARARAGDQGGPSLDRVLDRAGRLRRRRAAVAGGLGAACLALVLVVAVLPGIGEEPQGLDTVGTTPSSTTPPAPDTTATTGVPTTPAPTTTVPITDAPTTTTPPLPPTTTPPSTPERSHSLDGSALTAFPDEPIQIAFISPGMPLGEVEARFGPSDEIGPDGLVGPVHIWRLPGGASLHVEVYAADVPPRAGEVFGVTAIVPEGSPVRFALYRGLTLGTATMADLVAAWGPGTPCRELGKSDCDLLYVFCHGGWAFDLAPADVGAPFSDDLTGDPATSDRPLTRFSVGAGDGPPPPQC